MFCTKCGQENKDDSNFCKRCGNPLEPIIDDELLEEEINNGYSENNNVDILEKKVSEEYDNTINNTNKTNRKRREFKSNTNQSGKTNNILTNIVLIAITICIISGIIMFIIGGYSTSDDYLKVTKVSEYKLGNAYKMDITFEPIKDFPNIESTSVENVEYTDYDGTKYYDHDQELSGLSGLPKAISTDEEEYYISFYTKVKNGQFHKHIKCDIVAHTANHGNITICRVDHDVEEEDILY